ncbi:hypothetical protein EDD85DRAFT_784226 [Armillaria nabsnona]|nr:hypothetical protein EDD85DRAFT_784226 [Armillaria nabsnona]
MAKKLQGNLALVETGAIATMYAGLDGNIYMGNDYNAISGHALARAMSRLCLAGPSSLWICQWPTVKRMNVPDSDINNPVFRTGEAVLRYTINNSYKMFWNLLYELDMSTSEMNEPGHIDTKNTDSFAQHELPVIASRVHGQAGDEETWTSRTRLLVSPPQRSLSGIKLGSRSPPSRRQIRSCRLKDSDDIGHAMGLLVTTCHELLDGGIDSPWPHYDSFSLKRGYKVLFVGEWTDWKLIEARGIGIDVYQAWRGQAVVDRHSGVVVETINIAGRRYRTSSPREAPASDEIESLTSLPSLHKDYQPYHVVPVKLKSYAVYGNRNSRIIAEDLMIVGFKIRTFYTFPTSSSLISKLGMMPDCHIPTIGYGSEKDILVADKAFSKWAVNTFFIHHVPAIAAQGSFWRKTNADFHGTAQGGTTIRRHRKF